MKKRALGALFFSAAALAADLDPSFLNLPAHDLEIVSDGNPSGEASRAPQVGDTLTLKINQFDLPNAKVEVPPGNDSLADQGFRVEPKEGKLLVTPLKPGNLILPSLALEDVDGKPVARTNPMPIEVRSAIAADDPKPEEPVDLRPPVGLPFPWPSAIAAGLAVLALLALAYWLWRKYGGKRVVAAVEPVRPARPQRSEDEEALIALAEVEREGPLKQGGFKAHYFRLSEILKNYCGRRWGFDAMESTTAEMIRRIDEEGTLAEAHKQRLRSLFERLDRVKFTDFKPLPDEAVALVSEARDFVMLSKRPRPVTDPAGRPA